MEIIEKVSRAFKQIDERETEYITKVNKLKKIKSLLLAKLKKAESKMIAKDYFAYRDKLNKEYNKLSRKTLKGFSYEQNREDFGKIARYVEDNLKVSIKELFNQVAEFLTLQTGKHFEVKKCVENIECGSGHGYVDYCDVNYLKIMHKDKEIFRSKFFSKDKEDDLQQILLVPYDYYNIKRYGNLHLILPPNQTVEMFNYLLKHKGYGFADENNAAWFIGYGFSHNYENNVAYLKSRISNFYNALLNVAPEFDLNRLSNFLVSFANSHCKTKSQNNNFGL